MTSPSSETTRRCDRCGLESAYSKQWVEIRGLKGSVVQFSELLDWDCWLEKKDVHGG